MDADTKTITRAIGEGWEMRVGRKLGRTLYLHPPGGAWEGDLCVGIVDSAQLADSICALWNHANKPQHIVRNRSGESDDSSALPIL